MAGHRISWSLILFSCGPTLLAQDTWAGLRFRMTEQEVLTTLKGRDIVDAKNDPTVQPLGRSFSHLYVPFIVTDVHVEDLKGVAHLAFHRGTGGLAIVSIRFNDLSTYLEPTTRISYERILQDQLTKKYGKPKEEYACKPKATNSRYTFCLARWQSSYQEIRFWVDLEYDSMNSGIPTAMGVTYSALPTVKDQL